MDIYSHLSWP